MQTELLSAWQSRRQQYSEEFSASVDVLADVHGSIDDEWKQRLEEINRESMGQRIVIFGYQNNDNHWIGIFLKIGATQRIVEAYFIDPLYSSEFNPTEIQRQFSQIYPNAVLRSKTFEKTDNSTQSATLTVNNLLKAIDGAQFETSNRSEITKEYLEDLRNDFSLMPKCLERSILHLIYNISLQVFNNNSISNEIDSEITKEFQTFHERLQFEELNYSIETISTSIKNRNWKLALDELKKLLKQIRPLNICELLRLVKKAENAAILIKDKKIIFLLGFTGAGKSTTIHFLAGSKMEKKLVNGYNNIIPTEIKNVDLKDVKTSLKMSSETRYITPVTINYSDVDALTEGSVILCDSPGFGDTEGAEVDIANGIGIIKAIKGCQSVKPIVLFSYKRIGDKCEGVKQLVHLLAGFIPSIKDHIRAFSYIFTKYPDDEKKTISKTLEAVFKSLNNEEKSDIGFIDVLKDMIKKTRSGTSAYALDPIKDHPGNMLDSLADSPAIENPDEVFELSITKDSKITIQKQLQLDRKHIESATRRFDYLLVKYKLDQMKRLNDLLHENYIEQIYNECTRYVTKHLDDEYQNGTSTFDRCLHNQTVLTNEDIQQYQTYISRFQLVDNWKEDHLGVEVVHSTAFTTHLNQSVKKICELLQETNIDYTSVKNNLDKLKLISNFFSNITSLYEQTCESMINKYNLIIQSFKNFVCANEFTESAKCLVMLANARMNLVEHLNFEQNIDLQNYFLNHLKTYTQESEEILKKTELAETDADKLRNCLSILESAVQTSTFEPHICLSFVKEMMSKLQSNILEYFNEIIKKIDVEQTNEISFKLIKEYMQQLDLLRKIPIIEIKTSELYWQILEKIIRFTHESRRSVEEQLRLLFGHADEFDHNKLLISLRNLKDAEWIDDYRSGVHGNILKAVKQELIQHIDKAKDLFTGIHLELDSFSEIRNVTSLIVDINRVKNLEQFIGSISQSIDTVNSWFEQEINGIFNEIKTAFNMDKLKEQDNPTIDLNKAEKACSFRSIYKELRLSIRIDSGTIWNDFDEYLRYYVSFVQKQMNLLFETIKQFNGENQTTVFEQAFTLNKRLEELHDIQTNYPKVLSYFSNNDLMKNWKECLRDTLNELTDEIDSLVLKEQTVDLKDKLIIIKALSRLDGFLDKDTNYLALYKKCHKEFFNQTDGVHRQVLDAISKFDYARVATEMIVLESSKDTGEKFFKQAKRTLASSLETLMEETKQKAIILGNQIEIKQIIPIVENLKRLQRAKQFVLEYIDSKQSIDDTINEVKQLIGSRMECILNNIQTLIKNNSFNEAENKIASVNQITGLLGSYCSTDISTKITNLQGCKEKAVKEQATRYSNMDIGLYTLHPPKEIFAKFREASSRDKIYNEALNDIGEKILGKFREELDAAKKQWPPKLNSDNIRRFESAVKYLPDDLKISLEAELKYCKEDISSNIEQQKSELDEILEADDLTSIETIFQKHKSANGMGSQGRRIQDTIRKQIQDLTQTITNYFDNHQISETFKQIRKLYEYKMKFGDDIHGIHQAFQIIQKQVTRSFQDSYLCFTKRFLNNYESSTSDDAIKSVRTSYIDLIEYMKFSYYERNMPILTDLFTEELIRDINEFKKNLLQFLVKQEKQNVNALEKLDIALLVDCCNALKQWNSVISQMKTYGDIDTINDLSVVDFADAIKKTSSYDQFLSKISDFIDQIQNDLFREELINEHTRGHEKQRNEFYRELNEKLTFIHDVQTVINRNDAVDKCIQSLQNKINRIFRLADDFIDQILSDSIFMERNSREFNIYYNNLLSFKQEIKIKSIDIHKEICSIEKKVSLKTENWSQLIKKETNIDDIAKYLISMKRTSNNLPAFSTQIKEKVDRILQNLEFRKSSPINLDKLSVILQQDKTGIGSTIISEHKTFEKISISIFHEKTQRQGIDYVLDNIKGDSIDKHSLKKQYEEFYSKYQSLIKHYLDLKSKMNLDNLISDIKFMTGSLKMDPDSLTWDGSIRAKIPIVAAHVFALWTLESADNYFESDNFLRQPHAAQVISIFRMLGIGSKNERLGNNLVQIKTGEGKSITLGTTAVILALLGFDIHCACYSEYLSERDYRTFLPLFNALGLTEYIHYGTFNNLCESIINENGKIRDKVEQFISKNSNTICANQQRNKRPKVLLIDEVDIFFSKNFYGNVYTPSACIKDPIITALINYIWQQRKSKLTLKQIENTNEYQACLNRFPNWTELIIEAVKDLLFDVQNFQSHDYVVKQDRIGYVEQDNIAYNVTYGYKTLFAYYCEHERGNISRASLDQNIGITIKCGSFSYAEMPSKFAYIMGVTGTLEKLSEPEKRVIEDDYKIKKNTYMPSVFGDNKLQFIEKDDIKLENDADYFIKIAQEINYKLLGRQIDKRAVIVVFESIQKLKEFYESKALEPIKASVSYLTEDASAQEKEDLVRRATTSGQITLITRTFGRGTDFICLDQRVEASGGVHVIQTFLSEEASEEVQIKGRTARQSQPGSFSLILNYRDLERFDIKIKDIEDIKKGISVFDRFTNVLTRTKTYNTIYEYLNDKRTHLFKTQYEDNMKYVIQAKQRHDLTQAFLVNLNLEDTNSVREFLIEKNKGVEIIRASRTICLMDATGSMTNLLHKCKTKVDEMIQRTLQILIKNGYNPNTFQIQLVVYRNYNSREEKILQVSPWETKADNLRTFLNTIQVEGGMGNEAIEIGLLHANRENEKEPITQVILIGDAPPNTREEVTGRRKQFGEDYWKGTKFAQATYYEDELAKLSSNNIPIHAFFVDKGAEVAFRMIATATEGRCEFLDINAEKGSEILAAFIAKQILQSVGGAERGHKLANEYEREFGRSYL